MAGDPFRPFDRLEKREELRRQLEEIPGIAIPEDRLGEFPGFQVTELVPPASYDTFIQAIEWTLEEAREAARVGAESPVDDVGDAPSVTP